MMWMKLLLIGLIIHSQRWQSSGVFALEDDPDCESESPNQESCDNGQNLPEYLIVGAGSSGIQTALFLQHYGHSYIILEQKDKAGSFWSNFPRFRELISVNKWVRNETQRLRFDWHSLLHAPLQMMDVTEDYFPHGDDYQDYLQQVVEKAKVQIEYNVTVEHPTDDGTPCVYTSTGIRCAKHRVFMGTGLREKQEDHLRALGGIPYSKVTKTMGYHRRVCILGNGNSAFEVAQNLVGVADRIVMYGRHPHRFSAVTRYTGDVRLKFSQTLENFNGKLLDTVDYFAQRPELPKADQIMSPSQVEIVRDMIEAASFVNQFECETLVLATGFRSHVPGVEFKGLFPPTRDWYSWKKNTNVHFVGWLMHAMDYRRGAGGFFSGYRYLIRNLIHWVREQDLRIPYPYLELTKNEVVAHAVARIQTADDLVILQDAQTVKDVVIEIPTGNSGSSLYRYYEGITFQFHPDLLANDEQVVMNLFLGWGDSRESSRVFDGVTRYNDTGKLINAHLHPVVQVPGGLVRHVMEDFSFEWTKPLFVNACVKTLEAAMNKDYTKFKERKYFPYKRDTVNHGEGERDYEPAGTDPSVSRELVVEVFSAAQTGEFGNLERLAREKLPKVFEAHSIHDS